MKSVPTVEINLDFIHQGLRLWIDSRALGSLFVAEEIDADNIEAKYQLVEGCFYDYQLGFSGSDYKNQSLYQICDIGENIVQQHKRAPNLGTIAPNIFVGTLALPILRKDTLQEVGSVELEVQSAKSGYRDEYRDMLSFITDKCADLILQANSPVSQYLEIDYSKSVETLYQKFAFIKSVIESDDFAEAIHRIVTAPVTKWSEIAEEKDIRNIRRISNANVKEIMKVSKRIKLPEKHYLRSCGLDTIPDRITTVRKTDSVDTPENRFIKYVLENFLKFCTDINIKAREFGYKKMEVESEFLISRLEGQLHHTVFTETSRPTTLNLNSPVLQRKEGYREMLRAWLMFDLAAKLIWKGGDDVYKGGKKDVANLYEYWLFFKLLDLFESVFNIDSKQISELIKETPDGLNLQIKQGEFTALNGIYNSGKRKLNVRFNYNRSFSGKQAYPKSGSWTTTLRPDYTLSLWPLGISEPEAENQELIVHIHFDAKYKISNLPELLKQNIEGEPDEEKIENRKGIYKNADLLKMHAYKDAIRRTGGAYVLYPGDKSTYKTGFHEILPGLGAFAVSPSSLNDGIGELREFILQVVEHFINRTSQRERMAFKTYDIYKNPPAPGSELNEALPEVYGDNRSLIPDETFVLIGFYKDEEHLNWICKNKIYNTRIADARGSVKLGIGESSAKYLLLHTHGETNTGKLFKLVESGPRIYSRNDLDKLGYQSQSKTEFYLVYKIDPIVESEFENVKWDISKLPGYTSGRGSGLPFSQTLTELMRSISK